MSEKKASIDIGSNSSLLLAAELDAGKILNVLANESRVTGLGRGLDKNGMFLKVSMDETFEALSEYVSICDKIGIGTENIIATATEASRVSSNAKAFFSRVKQELGLEVKIITGEEEAEFSTKGVLLGAKRGAPHSIMDIGGASTEFISVDSNGDIQSAFSVPVGSVRMTDWLEEDAALEKLGQAFEKWKGPLANIDSKHLICVAGTLTSLANMHLEHKDFHEKEVHGHVLNRKDVEDMWNKYKNYSPEKFLDIFPFLGKRSRAIKGGLLLALKIAETLNVESFEVSTYGLRYGTLIS